MGKLVLELVVLLILIGINAFLAASEIAIVRARKTRMRALAEEGNPSAKLVLEMNENPTSFLATIQVGITLASFFAAAFGAVTLTQLLRTRMEESGVAAIEEHGQTIALVIITFLLASLSIILGELVPKTLAVHRADAIALRVARPIDLLSTITRPLVWALTSGTNLVLRLFGSHENVSMPSVTQAEILALLEAAEDEGVVEAEEAELVEDALQFGETLVRSVMVPRVDVVAIDAETTLGDAIDVFLKTGYSRLPVYRESLDNVVGVLYVKDALRQTWTRPERKLHRCEDAVRPPFFVPESKPIDELLQELRERRTHLALVIDEYGGLAGLVTLEDLLEELVGEIADEFDPGYEPIAPVVDGVFDVDGRLSVSDLLDRLDLEESDLTEVDAESIGGLIVERLERIPEVGDIVDVGPFLAEVREMDGYRVGSVRITLRDEVALAGAIDQGLQDGDEEEAG